MTRAVEGEDNPSVWLRVADAISRSSTPARVRGLAVAALLGWVGLSFIAGWSLVRLPRGTELRLGEQPAPNWPWQLGTGLVVLAAIALAAILASAPRRGAGRGAGPADRERPTAAMTSGILIGFDLPMVISGLAAPNSSFRWVPIALAVVTTAMVLINLRTHRFW